MKQVNGQRLKQWLSEQGEDAKVHLHLKSGVSLAWIEKVIAGKYKSVPRPLTRRALISVTGLSETELFPEVAASGKRRSA